jgi:hypothetical protein
MLLEWKVNELQSEIENQNIKSTGNRHPHIRNDWEVGFKKMLNVS